MTTRLAQVRVNKYSTVLGYEFRGGRSTTAKLHQVENKVESAMKSGQKLVNGFAPLRAIGVANVEDPE